MTLSGFLFAKLLDGKSIDFAAFLKARFWRLAPLLFVVLAVVGAKEIYTGVQIREYLQTLAAGFVLPVWPSGAWSIAVEMHFYILLPLLLWITKHNKAGLLTVLVCSFALRCAIYLEAGELKTLAYSTIVGRIDQFVLGILAFHFRHWFARKHLQAGVLLSIFSLATWQFDRIGGNMEAPKVVWIVWPLIEGAGWAALIAWYDSLKLRITGISKFIGLIGTYSYSIYLLHFFVVYHTARFIHRFVDLTNFYVALPVAAVCFLGMVPIGYLSFRFIESPFLKRRIRYVRQTPIHAAPRIVRPVA